QLMSQLKAAGKATGGLEAMLKEASDLAKKVGAIDGDSVAGKLALNGLEPMVKALEGKFEEEAKKLGGKVGDIVSKEGIKAAGEGFLKTAMDEINKLKKAGMALEAAKMEFLTSEIKMLMKSA